MYENQEKNGKEEEGCTSSSACSPNGKTGPPTEQELNKKRYAVNLIEKRTGLLIIAATLAFISISFYVISQKNIYVYRDVWHILGFSKNVSTLEFDSYKTIQSSTGFELLSNKFKHHQGVYGIEYNPNKDFLKVYINDSIVTEDNIRKILHTKSKHAVAYPQNINDSLSRYRFTIANYYDSFDGLILKNKFQSVKGVYYIESEFKKKLYVDIFGSSNLNVDALKSIIESPSVVMPLKKKPTEVSTDYEVTSIKVTNATLQRNRILNKIFIKNSYKAPTKIKAGTKIDTLKLVLLKFPIGRKLTYWSFLKDVEVSKINIISVTAQNTVHPELAIVFESKGSVDKNKLYKLLNRPRFIHLVKEKKRVVENPYCFLRKN